MRFRLAVFVDDLDVDHQLAKVIEIECGVRVPWLGTGRDWKRFYGEAEIRDVLDSVTHTYKTLLSLQKQGYAKADPTRWRAFVVRVLSEEHTQYIVDDECQVRYAVDESYVSSKRAALAGLDAEKWGAARSEFERAYAALDQEEQDTNAAVRAIAAAVESCAKLLVGNGMARLGPSEVQKYLRPKVEAAYANDRIAIHASALMLKSLAEWVNSTHQYRHGQDVDDAVHAPLDLAVQFLTSGSGFVRWLIDIDGRVGR